MSALSFDRTIGFDRLKRDVIRKGLCAACGTCAGVCPMDVVRWDFVVEEPALNGKCISCGMCYALCPGRDIPMPQMEGMLFSKERLSGGSLLGFRRSQLYGFSLHSRIRARGAGGGVTTALLTYALDSGQIDGAIVAGMNKDRPWMAEPKLASTTSDVLDSAQSKYAIVPSNMILKEAAHAGKRLGLVGVPCQIEGFRKIQMYRCPTQIADKVQFAIGIFCGSNIPRMATEYTILKETGGTLDQTAKFEYRGGPRSQDILLTKRDGNVELISSSRFGAVWQKMLRDRCGMCLDLTSELADVSVGDIFLPLAGVKIPKVSAVLVRSERGEALVNGACKAGYLEVSKLADSGLAYNIGIETKGYFNPYRVIERRRRGLPTTDYHREVVFRLPERVNQKEVLRRQMVDIPELADWVRQDAKLNGLVSGAMRSNYESRGR